MTRWRPHNYYGPSWIRVLDYGDVVVWMKSANHTELGW